MPIRPQHHLRSNLIARRSTIVCLALLLAVGVGSGYALAASTTKTKTITVCADKNSGLLHLTHGRCKRGQTRVTWNQQGPRGSQGEQGAAGQPGAPAVSVWAEVTNSGSLFAGQGLTVQHLSAGTYQVTITAPACAHASNAPAVTPADGNPPVGQAAGAFPVAWYASTGLNQQFMVFTGDVVGGSFSASDHSFTVMDACM